MIEDGIIIPIGWYAIGAFVLFLVLVFWWRYTEKEAVKGYQIILTSAFIAALGAALTAALIAGLVIVLDYVKVNQLASGLVAGGVLLTALTYWLADALARRKRREEEHDDN